MTVLADLGGPAHPGDLSGPALPAGSSIHHAPPGSTDVAAYRALRHAAFVADQGLFADHDLDRVDADPRTVVLVCHDADGTVVGGVRVSPQHDIDLGWWTGSRLVCRPDAARGVGAALVRAACATVEAQGALRFDALVQARHEGFFSRLGWHALGPDDRWAVPHVRMRWPIDRLQRAADGKADIGAVLAGVPDGWLGGSWVGDDGVPVPGSDVVAACDAILPSMVDRDPWWAGWCAVLVNVGDLAAMGAVPVGLLDALGAPTRSLARRVMAGISAAAQAWDVPVLGGHTQIGVPAALSMTALGRTATPVPSAGGRPGMDVHVTADLGGRWRPSYTGRQWDSTTHRSPADLRAQTRMLSRSVAAGRHIAAAKDVSMAGLVGTLGMLAEASGCGAELEVAAVPRPAAAGMADWLTCFPGFVMVSAGEAPDPGPAPVSVARCGRLVEGTGVTLVWPDGARTTAVAGPVTHLPTPSPT